MLRDRNSFINFRLSRQNVVLVQSSNGQKTIQDCLFCVENALVSSKFISLRYPDNTSNRAIMNDSNAGVSWICRCLVIRFFDEFVTLTSLHFPKTKTNLNYRLISADCRLQNKPPFTISDIRAVIPAHCFNRSIITSLFFLAKDIFVLTLLVSSTRYYDNAVVPARTSLFLWPLYWVCAGCVGTGLWMLGHECGHHAFSDYLWVDNSIGLAIHSFLLVPFFSW